jgi:hypothetical protein
VHWMGPLEQTARNFDWRKNFLKLEAVCLEILRDLSRSDRSALWVTSTQQADWGCRFVRH